MKKLTILIMWMCCSNNSAFSQNWQWAKQVGSDYQFYGERANSVISDGINQYLIGAFGGQLFLQNDTLNSNGNNDIFIIKYDPSGNEIWSKRLGGNYTNIDRFENARGVYDPVNNCIYVAGEFINVINFGGSMIFTSYAATQDIFLARMDLNGNFAWVETVNGNGDESTYLQVDPTGNVLLAGKLEDTTYFDTIKVNPGGFFARYDSNGNCLWAEQKFSGPEKYKINIGFIGDDVIMGGFFDTNSLYIDTAILISQGSYDGYITRLDSVGRVKWIKKFGNTGVDGVSALSIDNLNNIYITGGFENMIDLGGLIISDFGRDFFIAKLNENGNGVWARQALISGNSGGGGELATKSDGSSYIVGQFSGNASFGSNNISTSNPYDMFLTRYDSAGNCKGVLNFGQASGLSVCTDNSGAVYCTGAFLNSVNIGNDSFTSYFGQDAFIAKSEPITGVPDSHRNALADQLFIYANPNNGSCTINIPADIMNEQDVVLNVYSIEGKLVKQISVNQNLENIKINLEAEAKGIYNVTLGNDKKTYTGKVVFQ